MLTNGVRRAALKYGVIIVSRHPAAVEFIRQAAGLGTEIPVVDTISAEDLRAANLIIYGNVPLHIAVLAKAVVAIEFDGVPPRGAEYTLAEMQAVGAHLRAYRALAVHLLPFDEEGEIFLTDDGRITDNPPPTVGALLAEE